MSYCSRSCRRRFIVLDFKSWAYSRICGHFQQHLYCACAEMVIYELLVQNLDTTVRFADPDFLLACKISAIWRRFTIIIDFIFWTSAIFLLPGCLTYWPRKYTTRVDPHVDNSHQVWSWYDYPLPSNSVFVCWYVTWHCAILTLSSCSALRVTWPTLPPSFKTLRLSVLSYEL